MSITYEGTCDCGKVYKMRKVAEAAYIPLEYKADKELAELLRSIHDKYGNSIWQVRTLKQSSPSSDELAMPRQCEEAHDPWRSLGHYIAKRAGIEADGLVFTEMPRQSGGATWQVLAVTAEAFDADGNGDADADGNGDE